jgi:hypothetical protein
MMAEISEAENIAALRCIAIINCHFPLNEGERRLLGAVMNDIRLAFDLEGAVNTASLLNVVAWAPREWFW